MVALIGPLRGKVLVQFGTAEPVEVGEIEIPITASYPDAEPDRCPAICAGEIAERFGYVTGSRCTGDIGHSTLRNGVGHYFAKR